MAKQTRNASDASPSKRPSRTESTTPGETTEARSSATAGPGTSTAVADSQPKAKKTARREPTTEDIQARAYKIFLSRNGAPGDPESDWLQAERELREEYDR